MAYTKMFLTDDWFQSLNTSGSNTNVIVTNPLPYLFTPTGGIDGNVSISLQGTELTEVAYAGIDVTLNIGKFAISTNSTINFIVAKADVNTIESAKNYLIGFLVNYLMKTLSYYETTPSLYTLSTETSDGIVVGNTNASDLSDLISRIQVLDSNLNINTVGYYKHTLIHSLTNS